MGQDATPANERRFSNEHLVSVFDKTDAVARCMDEAGYHAIWLAEHHFQHEGYEVIPNLLMHAVHLAHVTRRIKIGRGLNIEPFSHNGKHYALPPNVPYRGYELKELTLVPRPIHRPVECWQPIVSASARGLDFMVRHGIKGIIGGGAATMAEGPFHGYREAAARAGKHLELGENLCLGIFIHLAETREKAIREIKPFYEEHVKMFGPLGFVPGITPAQLEASTKRGGWDAAGVPTVEHYMKNGAW